MFDQIGEGLKAMHEGVKKKIDLDELERLAKAATPGPWEMDMLFNIVDEHGILVHTFEEYGHTPSPSKANVRYIVAACNSAPKLIKRVRELERQRKWLADALENVCEWHKKTGVCPVFHLCPAGDMCLSCGEVTKEDWIQAAKEAGE